MKVLTKVFFILGFNGYQFTIAGKSIRIILFCISVFVLFLYSLAVMKKDGISLFKTKNSKTSIWKILRPFDYCVLLFIFGNALWATVIPMVVRGEMQFSLKDFPFSCQHPFSSQLLRQWSFLSCQTFH